MGILEELNKKPKGFKKKYHRKYGEIAKKSLQQGLSVSTLPAELEVPMHTIEFWARTQAHFRECVEIGLALQEKTLTQIGMNMAVKNKGNYKAWSALCRVKLGWGMEPQDNIQEDTSASNDISITINKE